MTVLDRLVLKDFRNYRELDLEFPTGVNLLVGENGQGKSTVLEETYVLAILRSFRCSKVRNLHRWKEPSFMIMGKSVGDDGDHKMGIEYGVKRRLRVDGETVRKASEFIGRLNVVAFVPEDIELIKSGASARRRFLDVTLTQLTPGYLQVLQSYEKALKSRNALLRSHDPHPNALNAYDQVLVDCGSRLIFHRRNFFQSFKPFIDGASTDLYPESNGLTVRYQSIATITDESSIDDIAALLQEGMATNAARDRKYGQTHSGPHRDDFLLHLDGRPLSDFGSEGQCRLAAMALKLAKARLMFDVKGKESVILLVDDVIGELDERGCKAFMSCVGRADQAFIACTESDKIHGVEAQRVFTIEEGKVVRTDESEESNGTTEEE